MEASREEKPSAHVTDARARAQRAKLDLQEERFCQNSEHGRKSSRSVGKTALKGAKRGEQGPQKKPIWCESGEPFISSLVVF